jgi:hypothetical protein
MSSFGLRRGLNFHDFPALNLAARTTHTAEATEAEAADFQRPRSLS